MKLKTKRYIISTAETLVAAFLAAFFLQFEGVLSTGGIPTKEIYISAMMAGGVAISKGVIKPLREHYFSKFIK